tara:strand:- start:3166 stop:4083 length:918 start_codon:yes stop_codon:yes gene_type:complete
MKKISILGDSNVDMLIYLNNPTELSDPKLYCGGSSANVAYGLSKLGNDVHFFGSIGNDIHGKFIIEDMNKSGVNIDNLDILDTESTAMVIGVVDTQSERNLFVWPPDNAAHSKYQLSQMHLDNLINNDWLHVSGISLRENPACESMLEAMKLCFQNDITVSFDLNLRIELWGLSNEFRKIVLEAISYSNYIFGSLSEEFQHLYSNEDFEAEFNKELNIEKTFIVRDGKNGSICYLDNNAIKTPGFSVNLIDTVGAGDAFNTGFIHSKVNHQDLNTALIKANAVAAYKIQGHGARHLPDFEQLSKI